MKTHCLDTFQAVLRRPEWSTSEDVIEIQDLDSGDLLCYATPSKAEQIASALQACAGIPDPEVTIPALVEALKNLCEEVSDNVPGYHQAPVVQTAQALLSTINLPTT